MPDKSELEALRTRVANQAASLAEAVTDGFEDFHMGAGDYVVELTVPEGPSTAGGKQALQHLRLVARRKGYATVIAGSVDGVKASGELRTYEHVALLHEARFQKPLEITPDEYEEFLRKAEVVLNLARIRPVTRAGPPPELVAQAKARNKISMPALVIFLVVVVLAAIVMYKVFARTM